MGFNDNVLEDYRNIVTNVLLSNPTIVSVLSDGLMSVDNEDVDSLLWTHILPQQYVPDVVVETGSYIFYDFEEKVYKVDTYEEVTMYFWVVTHKDMPKYQNRLRNDILSRELKYIFGEKDGLGIAPSHFISNKLFSVYSYKYMGRILTFNITDFSDKSRVRD